MPILRPKPVVIKSNRQVKYPRIKHISQPSKIIIKPSKTPIQPKNNITVRLNNNQPIAKPVVKPSRILSAKARRRPSVKHTSSIELSESQKSKINRIQNIGQGKILIIVANGPSINEIPLQNLTNINKIDILSINRPDMRIWPTTYWLFCDQPQYKRNRDLWANYSGILINTVSIPEKNNTIRVPHLPGEGFSLNLLKGFHLGRSSTYASMQVAYWMNYDHTYIFACDMTAIQKNGQLTTHHYGINPDVSPENRIKRFDQEAKHYNYAATNLPEHIRKKYTFCSSYLKYDFASKFNIIDHKLAIPHILAQT